MTAVNCETARQLLAKEQADDSATPEMLLAAREHYEACAACRQALELQWQLARRVRDAGRNIVAPADLRARIGEALNTEDDPSIIELPRRRSKRWVTAAVTLAAAASILFFVATGPNDVRLAPELVQVVQATSPADSELASSNLVELGQWLGMQVGYPVQVPDIPNAVLRGGRVTQVGGRATAAVTYELAGGTLTYFAMAESSEVGIENDAVQTLAADGYYVATWTEYGAPRALVARMPRDQVQALAEECRHMALNPAAAL